jgi:hypothetical protein
MCKFIMALTFHELVQGKYTRFVFLFIHFLLLLYEHDGQVNQGTDFSRIGTRKVCDGPEHQGWLHELRRQSEVPWY